MDGLEATLCNIMSLLTHQEKRNYMPLLRRMKYFLVLYYVYFKNISNKSYRL